MNVSKKPYLKAVKLCSDAAKQNFVVVFVDESNTDGSISKEKWKLVEQNMLSVNILKSNPGSSPSVPKFCLVSRAHKTCRMR